MKEKLLLFLCLFCISCNSTTLSHYTCGNELDFKDERNKNIKLQLVEANENEQYGIYQLYNDTDSEITLGGYRQGDQQFMIYGHDQVSWRKKLHDRQNEWESVIKLVAELAPPDTEITVSPGDSIKFLAKVEGINEFDVDLNQYAYRLSIRTKDRREIFSEPYCFKN